MLQLDIHPTGRHFLQIPGPEPGARPHPAGHEPAHHRPPRPRVRHAGPEGARRHQQIFKTKHPVAIYPASGTGAWEAALANTLSPGDHVLMYETGHFATLWQKMATRLGLKTEFLAWPARRATARRARLAPRRAGRADRRAPAQGHRQEDQGRVRGAQRNLHRRHLRHRRGAQGHRRRRATPRCCWSTASRAWRAPITGTTNGAWTSPSAARRRA
jgi:hypothetical protein